MDKDGQEKEEFKGLLIETEKKYFETQKEYFFSITRSCKKDHDVREKKKEIKVFIYIQIV